jgi:uncharacterized protein YjbJ (UPF0337 family)
MNQDQIKGKWEQLTGAAKQSWGALTDDDMKEAEGSSEKLYGIIHEKFGETKEAIKARLAPHMGEASTSTNDQPQKKETYMMRALRALFAVGVALVVLRLARRVAGRGK